MNPRLHKLHSHKFYSMHTYVALVSQFSHESSLFQIEVGIFLDCINNTHTVRIIVDTGNILHTKQALWNVPKNTEYTTARLDITKQAMECDPKTLVYRQLD